MRLRNHRLVCKDENRLLKLKGRILSACVVIALGAGCSRRSDPQAAYMHTRDTLSSGDMVTAASEAAKGYNDFHTLSPEWAWKFTILRARVLHLRGLNEDALKLLSSERAQLPPGELTVDKLRWEGLSYMSLHQFPLAEERLTQAERICSTSDLEVCPLVANAWGTLEMERGHYGAAQRFFERVLVPARASGDASWEAGALLNLSWSAVAQLHFDEALDWANAARKISLKDNYSNTAQKALGNMGWAYYKLGDPEKAVGMFNEAGKQAEKLGDTTDQIKWLTNAGYIYMDARDSATAEQSFTKSLKLSRQLNSKEDIINALIALAFASEQTGKLDDAKRYADEALAKAREDKNGRDQVYPQLVLGRVAARQYDTTTAENAFREVAQSPDCPVFLKWEAERSLARLYEDEGQFDSADAEYRTALTTFETARSELQHVDSRLPFLSNASRIYDDYIHFLVSRGNTNEALQVADFSRARTLSEGLGSLAKGTSFSLEPATTRSPDQQDLNARSRNARNRNARLFDPRRAGHAGGTILFYWLGEERSYLWAITPEKVALFPLPPAGEIKAGVERYRKAIIEQRGSTPTASDDGASLYRILVEPQRAFAEKASRQRKVFVVPDGNLNSLNFETLLVPETKDEPKEKPHYWIEDVTLSSAGSLRILQAFHAAHRSGRGNLLLFGDAIAPNQDFPQLPKASIEMDSIQKHFRSGEEQVFSRDQAARPRTGQRAGAFLLHSFCWRMDGQPG